MLDSQHAAYVLATHRTDAEFIRARIGEHWLKPPTERAVQTRSATCAGSKAAWRDHDPLTLLGRRRFDGHAGWFEVGREDRGPLAAARRLDAAAREAGMTTHVVVRSGKHNFTFWSEAFRHALPWLTARLQGDGSLASAP